MAKLEDLQPNAAVRGLLPDALATVGGIRGREALERLRNVVGRVESSWRPATAEEGSGGAPRARGQAHQARLCHAG